MHDQFGTVDPGAVIEARQETKTTTFPQLERGSCSPRGAVALSALAGVRWLQNKLKNLRRRIACRGQHETTRENAGAKLSGVTHDRLLWPRSNVGSVMCRAACKDRPFTRTSGRSFPREHRTCTVPR